MVPRLNMDALRAPNRRKPSVYPPVPFHLIRAASAICSIVVASIISYFTYHLHHDGYKQPWTFFFLLSVSCCSIVSLIFTTFLHFAHGLSPRLNLYLNAILFVLWALSFALSAWNMRGTLAHVCSLETWKLEAGVMICRQYKALFAFTVFGFVCSAVALFLDVRVSRRQMSRGAYDQMGPRGSARILAARGELKMGGLGGPDNVVAEDKEPARSYEHLPAPPELYSNAPFKSRSSVKAEDFGYTAPLEQTTYDAGTYR